MCTTVEPEPAAEEPVIVPVKTVEPEPIQEPEPAAESEPEEFIVSEELYVETFEDIRGMIENLNKIISSGDFNEWLTYLTPDYISYYSSEDQLSYFSDLYRQRGYNQRINDFNDYFTYVVVISRRDAVVDKIVFIDETHIKALTELKGKLSVLYYLEKNENGWKIGLKPEN